MSIQNKRDATRRLVHLSFGACALLVPILGRWPSVALAAAALAYNGLLAPRLRFDRGYRRDGEGRFSGLFTYPLAVLLLLLTCPLAIAAAAWGVLAVADPVAAAVGSRFPRPAVPGNPRKSVVGSAAGFVAGFVACYWLLTYMDVASPLVPALAAAAAAAIVESLVLPIDDNIPIAAASAATLVVVMAGGPVDGLWSVALVPVIAALALATRAVSLSGAVAGAVVGFCISMGMGWRGLFMLATFLVVGTLASRGSSRKRGPMQIFCNGAVAAVAALSFGWGSGWGWVAGAGALATGLSDTLAGELGRRLDARPRMLLFGARVEAGADGAMSWAGTGIGVAGAAIVALAGAADELRVALLITAAGVCGNLADSLLGATLQPRLGRYGNDIVNLLATAVGAAVAVALGEATFG